MREPRFKSYWTIVNILVVLNITIFVLTEFLDFYGKFLITEYLALSLGGLKKGYVFQLLTFQFLHGGWNHLFFNMLTLWMFGRMVEDYFGRNKFLLFYLFSGTVGGFFHLALAGAVPRYFDSPVVGASAGVSAVVAAFAFSSPNAPISLMFLPVSFPAKYLLWIDIGISVMGILVPKSNIAHGAHLGGIIAGILFVIYARKDFGLPTIRLPKKQPAPKPVKVVAPFLNNKARPAPKSQMLQEEFISHEVDPILDKISAHGIHSLTERERQILEAARRKMGR